MPSVRYLLWPVVVAALLVCESYAADCPDDSECCNNALLSHILAKNIYESNATTTSNTFWWVTETNTNVAHTTLCDGFPRALAAYEETSYLTTPTPVSWTTSNIYNSYTSPAPTCTIGSAACVSLHSAYTSSSSAAETDPSLPTPTIPACDLDCTGRQYCRLSGSDATLYYWPVTTTGDFCAATRTTVTGPATPRSTVLDGTTFVSPTAYIRIGTAHGRIQSARYGGSDCGPTRTNILIAYPDPAGIATITYKTGISSNTKPLNLADLNTPAPAPLFFTNRLYFPQAPTTCVAPCTTTLPVAPGVPRLSVPTQVATADPQWADCSPLPFPAGLSIVPLAPEVPNWPKLVRKKRDN